MEGEGTRTEVRSLIRRCVLSILRQLEQVSMENSSLENVRFRLEWLLSLVLRYHESNIVERAVVDFLLEALAIISSSDETERDTTARCLFSGSPGRPRLNISPEHIEFLLERRFTVAQISGYLELVCILLSDAWPSLV